MCMKTCLCWRDLRTATIAVAVFALTTSLMQILVQVAVFTGDTDYAQQHWDSDPRGVIMKLYVALAAFDFIVVLFSLVLLIGIERNGGHNYTAVPWIIWIFLYIIYESAINIYYFSKELSAPNYHVFTNKPGHVIVPLVYWCVKEIILFIGWWCVVSRLCYWAESRDTDSTHHLVQGCTTGTTDSFGPVYYNGGSTHVQIRDNPASSCSHFDVVRPTSGCQVYGANFGRGSGGGGGYMGRDGGIYLPPRYGYN